MLPDCFVTQVEAHVQQEDLSRRLPKGHDWPSTKDRPERRDHQKEHPLSDLAEIKAAKCGYRGDQSGDHPRQGAALQPQASRELDWSSKGLPLPEVQKA